MIDDGRSSNSDDEVARMLTYFEASGSSIKLRIKICDSKKTWHMARFEPQSEDENPFENRAFFH